MHAIQLFAELSALLSSGVYKQRAAGRAFLDDLSFMAEKGMKFNNYTIKFRMYSSLSFMLYITSLSPL